MALKRLHRLILLLFLVNSYIGTLTSQEKLEKEYRLQAKEIPIKAKSFIDSLNFDSKIRWYKEEGLTEESVEAKIKHKSKKYSIEFDPKGKLQDIEIETNWDGVPKSIKNKIKTYLNTLFSKHSVCKIQKQYTGERKDLLALISKDKRDNPHTLKYEIVLKGKNKNGKHLYEFLFSNEGNFETMSRIIFRNTDNMEF